MENNRIMKAISELNEAKYNLEKLKIEKNYVEEIENKISILRGKLGIREVPEATPRVIDDENERLRAKIAARRAEREERKKKVLDLLKKD